MAKEVPTIQIHDLTPESKQLYSSWVENGFNQEAVAVYGGSGRVLKNILQTGTIPPHQNIFLDYQIEMTRDGSNLYYTLPLYERIKAVSPLTAEEILADNAIKGESERNFMIFSKESYVRTSAINYALDMALRHGFNEATGITANSSTIIQLAKSFGLAHDYLRSLTKLDPYNSMDSDDPAEYDMAKLILSSLSQDEFKKGIEEAIAFPAVVFYFNKSLLDYNHQPGVEIDGEILVTSKTPLPASVISGIEIIQFSKTFAS